MPTNPMTPESEQHDRERCPLCRIETLTEKLDKAREALEAYVDDHDDAVTDINRKQGLDHPEAECDCDLCLNARPLLTHTKDNDNG